MDDFRVLPEFSDYDQIRPLNATKGGLGDVFLGHKKALDVKVVIKRVQERRVGKLDQSREAEILKNLKHQYLPRIYDMITTRDGYVYTVMDYIEGMDLQRYVRDNGPVDESQALKWAMQLCEVVSFLHGQNPPILHCDIKPANVMITTEGNICLIDFNTSSVVGRYAQVHAISPGYGAPEQYARRDDATPKDASETVYEPAADSSAGRTVLPAEDTAETVYAEAGNSAPVRASSVSSGFTTRAGGYGEISVRTDIYAIGATLYFMVSGRKPEKALDPLTPISALNLKLSPAFENVIMRAMEKEQDRRFSSADQMLRALQDCRDINTGLKHVRRMKRLTAVLSWVMILGGVALSVLGVVRMAKENEERYFTAISTGDTAVESGDYETAKTQFDEAIAMKPERMDAYLANAALLYCTGQYQPALASLDELDASTVIDTRYVTDDLAGEEHYLRGLCLYELGDYAGAVEEEKTAVELLSDDTEALLRLAMAQAKSGDSEGAKESLAKLEAVGGNQAQVDIILAEIEVADGDTEAAHKSYEDVIEETDDTDLLQHAYMGEADLYEQEGDTASEIALLEQGVQNLPESSTILMRQALAEAYLSAAADKPEESGEDYEKALDLYQGLQEDGVDSVVLRLNTAAAEEGLGQYTDALNTLLALQEDYPYDYRADMRIAFLYLAHHGELGTDEEDFANAETYYESAQHKYEQAMANGSAEDPNMTTLSNLIQEMHDAGY